jgi:hypothetical protein
MCITQKKLRGFSPQANYTDHKHKFIFYLKQTLYVSITETNQVMLFGEIIGIYATNHVKYIHII